MLDAVTVTAPGWRLRMSPIQRGEKLWRKSSARWKYYCRFKTRCADASSLLWLRF